MRLRKKINIGTDMALWQQLFVACLCFPVLAYKKNRELQLKINVTTECAIATHMLYIIGEAKRYTYQAKYTGINMAARWSCLAGWLPAPTPQSPYLGYRLPTRPSYLRCLELRGQLLQIHRNVESWLCQTIDHHSDVLNQSFLHRLINADTISRYTVTYNRSEEYTVLNNFGTSKKLLN